MDFMCVKHTPEYGYKAEDPGIGDFPLHLTLTVRVFCLGCFGIHKFYEFEGYPGTYPAEDFSPLSECDEPVEEQVEEILEPVLMEEEL